MHSFEFLAFGTHWAILTDGSKVTSDLKKEIINKTDKFENRFSRFKEGSEATKFRSEKAGEYPISDELSKLLLIHSQLKETTDGSFDPAVGGLLEAAGYDSKYSFTIKNPEEYSIPKWSVSKNTLSISGPVVFDFGGIGKGYWIDQISKMLLENGYKHHLVDGGRDIYATTKANSSGWKIAIEIPGRPGVAVGTVSLKNQGFASSDSVQRAWKNWHHLVDLTSKTPQTNNLGSVAIAESALRADMMTSVLSFCDEHKAKEVAKKYSAKYLIFKEKNKITSSSNWDGELFTTNPQGSKPSELH